MMLKQATPSRNLKTRGFKVKHALKIFLLLAISIWLLYQVKHQSHFDSDISDPSSEKIRQVNPVIKFGRKDLKVEKEEETEIDHSKVEEINAMEGRGGGDDEIDGNDQERAEEEEDEEEEDSDSDLEDLIDEEDQEKEEPTVVEEDTVESSQTKEDDVSGRNEDEIVSLRKAKEDGLSFPDKKRIEIHDLIDRDEDSSEKFFF